MRRRTGSSQRTTSTSATRSRTTRPRLISKLRFGNVDISTLFGDGYNPGVAADFRGIDKSDVLITLANSSTLTAKGLALEAPTVAFSATGKGAGFNASLTVNLGGSLGIGNSVYVNIGMRIVKGEGVLLPSRARGSELSGSIRGR